MTVKTKKKKLQGFFPIDECPPNVLSVLQLRKCSLLLWCGIEQNSKYEKKG